MRILVIDGQGGRIGRQLIEAILEHCPGHHITAVGTNSTATASMLKGGAHEAATGENSVRVACRRTDVIVGPIGIVIADSLIGEVTPEMALAVAQADAVRILIPMNRCENIVAGVSSDSVGTLIDDAITRLSSFLNRA